MKQFKISTECCPKNVDEIYFSDRPLDAWERRYKELLDSKGEIYDFIISTELENVKFEYFFIFLAQLKL